MTQCIMVYFRNGRYYRIPDTEVEDWDEVLDGSDAKPTLLERINGWAPYTHAYRLPEGPIYLVALGDQE